MGNKDISKAAASSKDEEEEVEEPKASPKKDTSPAEATKSRRRISPRSKSSVISSKAEDPGTTKMDIDEEEMEKESSKDVGEDSTEKDDSNPSSKMDEDQPSKAIIGGAPPEEASGDENPSSASNMTSSENDAISQSEEKSELTAGVGSPKTEDASSKKDPEEEDQKPSDKNDGDQELAEEEEEEKKKVGRKRRGKSKKPIPPTTDRVKRVRHKPVELYAPDDFTAKKVKAAEDASKDDEETEQDNKDDDEFQKEVDSGEIEANEEDDNDNEDGERGEEEAEEGKKKGKGRRRGRSEEPRSTTDGTAKRARHKPTTLYEPDDFTHHPKGTGKSPGKPKRARSQPKMSTPEPKKPKKDYVTITEGQGIKLRDIPIIRKTVEEMDINSAELHLVHRFLFSYRGRGSNKLYKYHILEFSGYMRKAKEGESEDKVEKENTATEEFMSTKAFKYEEKDLKKIVDFFHIDRSPTENGPMNKDQLIDKLLDFLCAPNLERSYDSSSGDDEEESGEEEGNAKDSKQGDSLDTAAEPKGVVADEDDGTATSEVTGSNEIAGEKKDAAAISKSEEANMGDDDKAKSQEVKKEDATKVVESEPKSDDTKTPDTEGVQGKDGSRPAKADAAKGSKASTGEETKEKETTKKDALAEESKIDPSTTDEQAVVARKLANAQTYQEWCNKARIEGAFYLVKEHKKGEQPSDAALRQWVQSYVACFDMSTVTGKHAIETASAKFGVNLHDRRDLIREFLVSEI